MSAIEEYYQIRFGDPERRAEFVTHDDLLVKIFKWNETQTGEDVAIYATSGASEILGDSNLSCEFFIGIIPQVDNIAQALAEVALHGNGTKSVPNDGDSISLTYPLWTGTDASNFLFTDGEEIIKSIKIGSKKVLFIELVPLFDSELDFKKRNGSAALWEKFKAMEVPYWNSNRNRAF